MVRRSTEAKGVWAPTIPHNGVMQIDLNKSTASAGEASRFSAQEFRTALGLFATGVTIVTALSAEGRPVGLTVNSFNSVSLVPPLVLWSLGLRAGTLPVFDLASHYAIHVLRAEQRGLAERFAARDVDRFQGVAWHPGLGGVPVLEGCAAVFQCAHHQQHDAGDHRVFIGTVQACERADGGTAAPLIFHGGRFYTELPL
jgi:flavin reductase (DIM6/NTAB) family NADH-FMN oxidoreductase RutF